MAFEHKAGQFTLFKNDKDGNESRPDYRGVGKDLAGNAVEVAGWIKKGEKGSYMSCRFQVPQTKQAGRPKATASMDDPDGDIPF